MLSRGNDCKAQLSAILPIDRDRKKRESKREGRMYERSERGWTREKMRERAKPTIPRNYEQVGDGGDYVMRPINYTLQSATVIH